MDCSGLRQLRHCTIIVLDLGQVGIPPCDEDEEALDQWFLVLDMEISLAVHSEGPLPDSARFFKPDLSF